MSWPVGTIVVCVNARLPKWLTCTPKLKKGSYYTVRNCVADGARLNELRAFINDGSLSDYGTPEDHALKYSRFRIAESSHSEASSSRIDEPVSL